MAVLNSDEAFVGIDLGTINSSLAFTDGNGNVEVLTDEMGLNVVPSVVLFNEKEKIVGNRAKNSLNRDNMKRYVSCFKRQIGTDIKRNIAGTEYSAAELSAMVIKKLLSTFKYKYGKDVYQAVITVPGDFDSVERKDTVNAANIAGLKNVILLNEPVAAALSYYDGVAKKRRKNLMVYDLGGGTLDISIFKTTDDSVKILSSAGDRNLGGRDWDLDLISLIQNKIIRETGFTYDKLMEDVVFSHEIAMAAPALKEKLYYVEEVNAEFEVMGQLIKINITKEEFDERSQHLANESIKHVKKAIANAKIRTSSIDAIILVGGAVRLPQIRRTIINNFPNIDVKLYDPELAVVKGAAICAESIFKWKKNYVTATSTKSFGILAGIDGEEKICNAIIKDMPLPAYKVLQCCPKRDDQDVLELNFYESVDSDRHYVDVSRGKFVSKSEIKLIGKISRGRTKFFIHFESDISGKITVTLTYNDNRIACDLAEHIAVTDEDIINSMVKMENIL